MLEQGYLVLQQGSTTLYSLNFWFDTGACYRLSGSFNVTTSTNPQLLIRARDDIITAFNEADPNAVYPSHLVLVEFNDVIIGSHSEQVS